MDAILMASGLSKRFGRENKLLVPFLGKPLLEYTLALVSGLPLFRHLFITVSSPAVTALAQQYPVNILQNSHPERGQLESIRLGVNASTADHYLFLPCDQPLLDSTTLERICDARQPGAIVQPCYTGRQGSPTLFSAHYRQELLALQEGEHPRLLKKRYADHLISVGLEREEPLLDIDTPEDFEILEALYGK